MAKGVYVGAPNFEPVTLPSGYTQLEYIQSSGTQCINTGFKPNQNTRLVMDATLLSTTSAYLYGCRGGSGVNYNNRFGVLYNGSLMRSDFGTGNGVTFSSTIAANTRYTFDQNKNVCKIGTETVTNSETAFASLYPILIFGVNESGVNSYLCSMRLYSCRIYDDGTLIRNFVPAKNSSGAVGLYDLKNGVFYANAGSGTFTAGMTYAEVARKVKKIYLGIDNTARKVKKGYIGDTNGLARLFFNNVAKIIKYTGSVTALSAGAQKLAAASNANYALFGGGKTGSKGSNAVDAYNSTLTRSKPNVLNNAREELAAASAGNYVLFAGGCTYYYYGESTKALFSTVDAYNQSLTKSTPTALSNARHLLSGASIGGYALFAGGYDYVNPSRTDPSITMFSKVDAYNASLTRISASSLGSGRSDMASTTIGNYALFAGGVYLTRSDASALKYYRNYVDAYNTSLTRTNATTLSVGRRGLAAAVAGDYALIAGGQQSEASTDVVATVDAYNKSLTRSTPTALSLKRMWMGAASLAGSAIFGGGSIGSPIDDWCKAVVDIYDSSLTRTTGKSLSRVRARMAACTIGNYAIFAGGSYQSDSGGLTNVDAYTASYD